MCERVIKWRSVVISCKVKHMPFRFMVRITTWLHDTRRIIFTLPEPAAVCLSQVNSQHLCFMAWACPTPACLMPSSLVSMAGLQCRHIVGIPDPQVNATDMSNTTASVMHASIDQLHECPAPSYLCHGHCSTTAGLVSWTWTMSGQCHRHAPHIQTSFHGHQCHNPVPNLVS